MEFGKKEKAIIQHFTLSNEDVRQMVSEYFWDNFQIAIAYDFKVEVFYEGEEAVGLKGYYVMGEDWEGEEE